MPSSRSRLTKEERNLIKHTKVLIVCSGWLYKNIGENNKDYQNDMATAIIKCYRRDLGFRKPKYFDPKIWERSGIIKVFEPWKGKFKAIRAIKTLSIMRKQRVFILWGPRATALKKYIEPNQGHLVLLGGVPGTGPRLRGWLKHRWFSTASDFLGESREMWRL